MTRKDVLAEIETAGNATPRPWLADPGDSGTIGAIVTVSGDTVAQAMQMVPRDRDPTQSHRRANAQMIASAGTHYLEVLRQLDEAMRFLYEGHSGFHGSIVNDNCRVKDLVDGYFSC